MSTVNQLRKHHKIFPSWTYARLFPYSSTTAHHSPKLTTRLLQYDLKLAEHQAGRAKSSCDAAYSKLCSALETAARLAAMPLTESNSRHQLQPAQNGTSRSTPMSRAESSDQQIGRIPRCETAFCGALKHAYAPIQIDSLLHAQQLFPGHRLQKFIGFASPYQLN